MSGDSDPISVYSCRWAWCRLNFSDNDVLGRHVVLEHVRRAIPVRRKDLPMLRRAEEGLGESLKLSDIMRNPSSSLSQKSEFSRGTILVSVDLGMQLKKTMKSLFHLRHCFLHPYLFRLFQLRSRGYLPRTKIFLQQKQIRIHLSPH